MAAGDKLWFELGVRDEVSQVMENLVRNAEKFANLLTDDAAELKNVYRNINDVANIYDKIYVAQKRISDVKGATLSVDEKKGLKNLTKGLEEARKEFAKLLGDPDRMIKSGEAAFDKLRTNVELMIKDTLRYVNNIEEKDRVEAQNAANEERRVDSLKAKYYELQRQRQDLANAIANAAPGTDLTGANQLLASLSGKILSVQRAQKNGSGMPQSLTGADAEEFNRRVKEQILDLTKTTRDYNNALDDNASMYRRLKKAYLDTQSNQIVANIKGQKAEYTALGQKLQDIARLMQKVKADEAKVNNGGQATYTNEKLTEELDEINRRYEQTLAIEKQVTTSKKKVESSTRKVSQATRDMAQSNQHLMSTFKELEKAGKYTNKMIDQMTSSFNSLVSFYGLKRLVNQIITIGGQFEFQHIALQNILGDVQDANMLFAQLQDLAVESPKTFMELTGYAKQLSAYQIPAEELYDTTKRLADMSTGLGVDMGRLILAYGQVRSAAVLRGQELRQFTEAGIPLVQKLADKFTELNGKLTTTADVFKLISARKVPFEMVRDVLWDMTNQGGQFYNMQSELADTLYGKWQKLQDTWQIMLGHLADGKMGGFLRGAVEGVVALTRSLDVLMPMLAWFGAGRMVNSAKGFIVSSHEKLTRYSDNSAINRLKVAKEQEVNGLLKRQLIYKEKLNAADRAKIATANRIMSIEYQQLAVEGRISEMKAYQLMLDGQMTKYHFKKLMLAKGYSEQQLKQIMQGRTQMLQQEQSMGSKIGKGVLNFMGGWTGVAFTAIGAVVSLVSWLREGDKELEMKGEAFMKHAQKNANEIQKILNNVDTEGSIKKRIEAIEDALIQTGRTGEAIVAKGRNNLGSLQSHLEGLRQAAEDYNKVLESMGGQEGKALFMGALKDSKIEDRLKDYDEAVNDNFRQYSSLKRFSEVYKDLIATISKGNAELTAKLSGKNLFEQIDIIGAEKLVKRLEDMYRGMRKNTPERGYLIEAAGTLRTHLDYLSEVDDAWKNITDKSIPKMKDELLAAAETLNISSFENLTPKQKQSLENLVREYVNGITEGSVEAKNKLAEELAKQVFHIKIVGDLTIDKTKLTDFGKYVWNRFGAGGVLRDKGNIKVGNNVYTKAQTSNIFADIDDYTKQRNQELVDARKSLAREKKLKNNAEGIAKAQKIVDDIYSELVALNLLEEKTGKGGGGSKKDELLERWKNRISLLEKYRKDLEELEKYMTRTAAIQKLREDKNYDALFTYFTNPNDYKKSVNEAIADLKAHGTTDDRKKYIDDLNAKKSSEDLRVVKDNAKDAVSELQRLLGIMTENYQTYKKWVELTGDEKLAARVAGITQNSSYEGLLSDLMQRELNKTNLALNPTDVFGLKETNAKKLGEDSAIYKLWEAWQENQKKIRKEQWSLYEEAIKGAKDYEAKIADINRNLQKEIDIIKALDVSDKEKNRMIAQKRKGADEQKGKLAWENFKETENWGRIFADLDRVSNETITHLLTELDKVAPKVSGSVEATKALYEAMEKLREQQEKRNPFKAIGQSLSDRSNINKYLKRNDVTYATGDLARYLGVDEGTVVNLGDKKTKRTLKDAKNNTDKQFNNGLKSLEVQFKALQDVLKPVIDLFDSLGDKTMSTIVSAGSNALGAAANTAGAFSTLSQAATGAGMKGIGSFLGNIGPWGAVASAALSVVSTAIGMFGADYADYEKMKAQYEGLIDVWDDLISRKKEYLSESWGVEAKKAGKEALELYKSEIEQTTVVAQGRLDAGASMGSHSMEYRMWQGSYGYDGKNWKDVAGEISRALGGVKFTSMADMLNMTSEQLLWIKKNYAGLWAHMDSDFKKYLDKLIEYGDAEKDLLDELQQKLTGMDFEDMVTNYGSALSQMENDNKALGENLEDNLKNAILNAMIANVYGARIKELIKLTNDYGNNNDKVYDEYGNVLSEYTAAEYAEIKANSDKLNEDMAASRDYLKNLYGWTDDNSSGSTNAIGKAITEQDTSLWSSYLNAIRLDVSVQRLTLEKLLLEVQKGTTLPESVMSQLRHLENIADYTRRNAEAAETISRLLKGVAPDGTYIKIK